jgi:hypothetical protein
VLGITSDKSYSPSLSPGAAGPLRPLGCAALLLLATLSKVRPGRECAGKEWGVFLC